MAVTHTLQPANCSKAWRCRKMTMDPLIFWTALGVGLAVVGQLVQFMHISSRMAERFAKLETHIEYLKQSVDKLTDENIQERRKNAS